MRNSEATQETETTFSHNMQYSLVQDETNPLESLMAPSLGLKSIFNMLTSAMSWSVEFPDVILYYLLTVYREKFNKTVFFQ